MNAYLLSDADVELLRSVISVARGVDIQRHDDDHAERVLTLLDQPRPMVVHVLTLNEQSEGGLVVGVFATIDGAKAAAASAGQAGYDPVWEITDHNEQQAGASIMGGVDYWQISTLDVAGIFERHEKVCRRA